MVPQTQITEMVPEGLYTVAHQCGPTYTGPSGGYSFVDGLIEGGALVSGAIILSSGLANITHYWAVKADHELKWKVDAWVYVPKAKPAPKVKSKPMVKADSISSPKRKKRRGRK